MCVFCFLPFFGDRVSHWYGECWLAGDPQGSSCLHFPSTRIKNPCNCSFLTAPSPSTFLITLVLETEFKSLCLAMQTVYWLSQFPNPSVNFSFPSFMQESHTQEEVTVPLATMLELYLRQALTKLSWGQDQWAHALQPGATGLWWLLDQHTPFRGHKERQVQGQTMWAGMDKPRTQRGKSFLQQHRLLSSLSNPNCGSSVTAACEDQVTGRARFTHRDIQQKLLRCVKPNVKFTVRGNVRCKKGDMLYKSCFYYFYMKLSLTCQEIMANRIP